MRLRVLGSSGAESPGFHAPAFLLDGRVLVDAGTVSELLTDAEQRRVRGILITHAHLDHIKGIPFLADNIIQGHRSGSVHLYATGETLASLKENLLNGVIWPDFTKIPTSRNPVLKPRRISPGRRFSVEGYMVEAFRVNHTVPAVGYHISDSRGRSLLYTGDTGPTQEIWALPRQVNVLIIEISFPNSLEALALRTGHLTASLLASELTKARHLPERILITHPKPKYRARIRMEVRGIRGVRVELLQDGKTYEI